MKTTANRSAGAGLLATFLFAFAGAVDAQTSDRADPGMLPDHPLYFLTSVSESIGTFFTFGEVNEAERALELSEKRLAEARALATDGKPDEAEKAIDRYETQLDRVLTKAEQARANGGDADEVLTDLSEATSRHQAVLAEVYEKVPEQARRGIQRAMEASKRGGERAAEARSGARRGPGARGQRSPGDRGRPDARDTTRPDADDRRGRGKGNRPDSVETGRPDSTDTGRNHR